MNLISKSVFTRSILTAAALLVTTASAHAELVGTAYEDATSRSAKTFPQPREVLQDGLNPHIGITAGAFNPEGSFKTGAEYGLNVGIQPYIPFGLGMSLTFSSNQAKGDGVRQIDRTAVLIRGTYNFGGNITLIKNSFMGIATGPVINQDATYFGLAPILGFDIPVREWSGKYLSYLSVGAEAKYMIMSSNESDGLTVNGAIKYWF